MRYRFISFAFCLGVCLMIMACSPGMYLKMEVFKRYGKVKNIKNIAEKLLEKNLPYVRIAVVLMITLKASTFIKTTKI